MTKDARFGGRGILSGLQGRLGDLGLGAAVVAVVVMMVVPLTPWLIDLLISFNLGLSVLVLSLSLFIARPLSFTAFPTLLLVATLYRLALNVSSTRLILLKANAGEIIGGFGGYVVGGDILVGAVIFGILAMVLFLVITKGAERVAEVAARFSLDALPGLQLAIDSDLRAGAISALEASKRRDDLDQRSRYYGALDGAMKFIRGDAIAALVIIGVNIVGGVSVGMLRRGMSVGEAIDTYGRLTVGDGLVTMIPALLISTAAGLIVTRVGQEGVDARLGQQLGRQLAGEPRALGAAASLMLALAFVPGLPAWPFVLMAMLLGVAAVDRFMSERRRALSGGGPPQAAEELSETEAQAVLEVGGELHAELARDVGELGGWHGLARSLAGSLQADLGLPVSAVPVVGVVEDVEPREVRLKVKGVVTRHMSVPARSVMCLASSERLGRIGVTPLAVIGHEHAWVSKDDGSLVSAADIEVLDPLDAVVLCADEWLRRRAGRLVGMDETQVLVDRVARTRPVLVRETVPKVIALPALARLLGTLVDDGLSLDHLPEVLEVLARTPPSAKHDDLVESARRGLTPVITARLLQGRDSLKVSVLGADMESVLEAALSPTSSGVRLALSPEAADHVVDACRRAAIRHNGERPVLLVGAHIRRALAELLETDSQRFEVVAHGEIEPEVTVEVVGRIES